MPNTAVLSIARALITMKVNGNETDNSKDGRASPFQIWAILHKLNILKHFKVSSSGTLDQLLDINFYIGLARFFFSAQL